MSWLLSFGVVTRSLPVSGSRLYVNGDEDELKMAGDEAPAACGCNCRPSTTVPISPAKIGNVCREMVDVAVMVPVLLPVLLLVLELTSTLVLKLFLVVVAVAVPVADMPVEEPIEMLVAGRAMVTFA
jgi:hypothetical protein